MGKTTLSQIVADRIDRIYLDMELPGAQRWAIEIKRGLMAKPKKGFYHALEDLKPDKALVVYGGKERYPIAENMEAINFMDMAVLLAGLER